MTFALLAAQAAIIINSLTVPADVKVATTNVLAVVGADASLPGQRVLTVTYPAASSNPAARDVQIAAEKTDWSSGQGLVFKARAEHPMRISVSFIDRNHVAYTALVNLTSSNWEDVAIAFDQIEPNPNFQPPDAKKGSAMDVSDVKFIAFAPQEKGAGRVSVTAFTVVK